MASKEKKSTFTGALQLVGAIFGVWLTTFVILPAVTSSCPEIQTLANFIDYSEIDTGQFYYTDVEIVSHADIGARSTIEYFANKG